jgi:predicted AlkP superfamily phosphohydrolase/phosphomutase
LLNGLEGAGLGKLSWVGARDRRAPTLWEIASHYDKRVVVANTIANLPVQQVNGAMIELGRAPDLALPTVHPASLAERWHPDVPVDKSGGTEESFAGLQRALDEEIGFTLELLREYEPEIGVYYTHFVDSVTHTNWDFWARDRFLLSGSPRGLSDEQWGRLVVEHREDRIFRVYRVVDRALARFVEAYPNATFIVISDHGWTYSGYEHFGSPDGVLIVSGPGIESGGLIEKAHIYDITPTVLALSGVGIPRELGGRVLADVVRGEMARHQVDTANVPLLVRRSTEEDVDLDEEEIERLRSLGYVQ